MSDWQPTEEDAMTDFNPNVSPLLKRPLRDLCPVCRERPAKPETEVCGRCEDDAQANVVDLDAADIKAWGG